MFPRGLRKVVLGLGLQDRWDTSATFSFLLLRQTLLDLAALDVDEDDEDDAADEAERGEDDVDGDGVIVKDIVVEGVDARLEEVDEAGEADDGAVHAAEGGEAEHLGRVVGHGGVVERTQQDEQDHVGVPSPQEGQGAENTDSSDQRDEHREHVGRADTVEQQADKRGGDDAADLIGAPDATGRQPGFLALLSFLPEFCIAEDIVELAQFGLAMLST
nr:hypothetical protein CFP56_30867 [Quercus suber]